MKKLATIFFFLSGFLFSQAVYGPESFLTVPFRADIDKTESILNNNPDILLAQKKDEMLVYTGKFAGDTIKYLWFDYYKNNFFRAVVLFDNGENELVKKYDNVYGNLIKKYGKPTENTRVFSSPYYEGDGYEDQAIRLNRASLYAYWTFDNGITIQIVCMSSGVALSYIHTELMELYLKGEEEIKLQAY